MERRGAGVLLALVAALPTADGQELAVGSQPDSACAAFEGVHTRRFHVASRSTGPLFVTELGSAPQLRIHCLELTETPAIPECDPPSVVRLCQRVASDICADLAEYAYDAAKTTTFGHVTDVPVRWLLLWDPRDKPGVCYPRDVRLTISFSLRDQNTGSTMIAIIAIIVVVVVVIIVAAFVLAQLLDRVRSRRRKMKEAAEARRQYQAELENQLEFDKADPAMPSGADRTLPGGPPPQLQTAQTPPTAAAAPPATGSGATPADFRPPQCRGGFNSAQIAGRALSPSASPQRDPAGDFARASPSPSPQRAARVPYPVPDRPLSLSPPNPLQGAFPAPTQQALTGSSTQPARDPDGPVFAPPSLS
eukprot:TRINITY_DN13164_c0_g1_i2.p1 TRINITY_DN13164_c0_g1~~TRINITY_DN13164_c0_g1_i2.p1  ORF type:complete len:363 (+),score=91.53 TRINITY_DN13164_c0_g1_i2:72-1160(+)